MTLSPKRWQSFSLRRSHTCTSSSWHKIFTCGRTHEPRRTGTETLPWPPARSPGGGLGLLRGDKIPPQICGIRAAGAARVRVVRKALLWGQKVEYWVALNKKINKQRVGISRGAPNGKLSKRHTERRSSRRAQSTFKGNNFWGFQQQGEGRGGSK